MENVLTEKRLNKYYSLLIFAGTFLYTSMMLAKDIFAAESATLPEVLNTSASSFSLANTYYFITYAIVQIILFFTITKINLKLYLIITVPISAGLYILTAFITNVGELWIIFALQGIMQAGIYSMTMSSFSKYLPKKLLSTANIFMSAGFGVGNTLSFGIVTVFIGIHHWELAFIVAGGILLASILTYYFVLRAVSKYCPKIVDDEINETVQNNDGFIKLYNNRDRAVFLVMIILSSFLCYFIYYGIMNWMPRFLMETFSLADWVSTCISISAPIIVMINSFWIIPFAGKRKKYDKLTTVFTIIVTSCTFLMIFLNSANVFLSVILILFFLFFNKATSTVLSSIMALDMRNEINSGTFCAITNAFASISAGVAPFVVMKIVESYGYTMQYIFITILGALQLLLSVISNFLVSKQEKRMVSY